jgi:hypothetical protein
VVIYIEPQRAAENVGKESAESSLAAEFRLYIARENVVNDLVVVERKREGGRLSPQS